MSGNPETLKPWVPGDPRRLGVKHDAVTRAKMSRAALKREALKRVARDHVKQEAVQQRLKINAERAALSRMYDDAIEILRQGEPEAAQRIVGIIRRGKDVDALSAARELLDRTRGRPVQVQRTVALTGQLSREEIAQLLAPAAPLLGLQAPSHGANSIGKADVLSPNDPPNDG